jgi:hypothetical protein
MPVGVQIATLRKVAKGPPQSVDDLPANIQWVMSHAYKRDEEKAGTFALDIWGTDNMQSTYMDGEPYIRGEPTSENTARAAAAAATWIEAHRSPGRPQNKAVPVLAKRLGPIFRASGKSIHRHRQKAPRNGESPIYYVERGPFYDFLELVLPPLDAFLKEYKLPKVCIDTVVRQTIGPISVSSVEAE